MEQKINEENIETNLVFCIEPRKALAIKSKPRSVFRNQSHKNKIRKRKGAYSCLPVKNSLNYSLSLFKGWFHVWSFCSVQNASCLYTYI